MIGPADESSPAYVASTVLGTDGRGADLIHCGSASRSREPNPEEQAPNYSLLKMNGRDVFKFAVRILGVATDNALDAAGLTAADLDLLVPHQANIRIVDAAAERYGMPKDRVICNVHRYGNTSAASIPLALADAREDGRLRKGMTIALVAFGAGLTYGASIVKW